MDSAACCYFPTITVLVDDQRSFLSKIELNLQEITALKSFEDPLKALTFINEKYDSRLKLDKIIFNTTDLINSAAKPDQHSLTIDVPAILKHLYDPKRFLEISDILVDYNMPTMNGIDLCEKIKVHSIRKLMITGDADTNIAIKAFNKGIISKFIPKQTDHFTQTLIDCIKAEKEQYFIERSTTIMSTLINDNYNCLQHPSFIQLFNATCEANNIIEYYMIDNCGSYLMLDKQGKPTWFIVRSEQALEDKDSVFYFYKSLIELRKEVPVITYGSYQDLLPEHPSVFAYSRESDTQTFLCINNYYGEACQVELPNELELDKAQLLLGNYPDDQSPVSEYTMTLRPYETRILLIEK